MKIVTAGHRCSVATGEEIREMRNNRRRIFSYSLIILFSICRGGEAAAAKLCAYNFAIGGNFTTNSALRKWAVGPDCAKPSFGQGNYETTETDPMKFCPNVLMHGVSRLVNSYNPIVHNQKVADQPELQGTDSDDASKVHTNCFCKALYPRESLWLMMGAGRDAISNRTMCNAWCGNMMKQVAFSRQLMSFGGWN